MATRRKIRIGIDEWYPVFVEKETSHAMIVDITLSEEEYREYKSCMEQFEKWQKVLKTKYQKSLKK